MIYHYKHKSIHDLTPQELDLLGYEGVYQYAQDHNIPPEELFQVIKKLETDIKQMGNRPFDMSHGKNLDLMNSCVDKYIKYFNKNATYDKQAYIILGNIASGKSTYAKSIETTKELEKIILSSVPRYKGQDGRNNVQRTFQAIRIEVNAELDALAEFLEKAVNFLNVGGRLAVISFHSLEDRIVKQKFKELATGCVCPPDFPICVCGHKASVKIITKHPVEASQEELEQNSRSSCAKLRVIEKI